jgi:hypothetical protein
MKILVGLKSENQGVGTMQNVRTKSFDVLYQGTEVECKEYLAGIREKHIASSKFYDENLCESALDRNYELTEKAYNKLYDKYLKMIVPKHDQYLLLDGEILSL